MKHETKWKKLKTLGRGGQGEVYLVEEIIEDEPKTLERIWKSLAHVSAVVYKDQLKTIQTEFADAVEQLIEARRGKCVGALKVLHSSEHARDPERARERAAREMKAMRSWQHPNLLELKDCDGDELWYVSEFHQGGTLDQHLEKYTGNLIGTLIAIRPLVDGVALLHKHDVVHRDIKPHNIFQWRCRTKFMLSRVKAGSDGSLFFSNGVLHACYHEESSVVGKELA